MFDNIDEEFRVSLISCIEYLKKYHTKYLSSNVLILSFIHFEDSLFNEMCPDISFDEVFNMILSEKAASQDLEAVLKEAMNISKNAGSKIIFDEYIFYACLRLECEARHLLEKLGLDIEKLKIDITSYINTDNSFLTNLTKLASEGKLSPFIGRSSYITKIIRVLSKKQKSNCMLIGSAGVGKSALVEGLALELYNNKSDMIVYRLDLGVIIAGTRYRGDLEERLVEVIDIIKESNAVLFIDEIHAIISSGNSEGSLDIANILKPALARNEIKCIGATTTEEYYKFIEKDKALERRFEKIFIPEASKEETYEILKGISNRFSEYYGIKYSNKILKEIIENCKFFPNRKFPDKAIDLMDEVSAYVKGKRKSYIKSEDIRKIVLENIGIIDNNLNKVSLNFESLRKYYDIFFMGLDARETICTLLVKEENIDYLLSDLEKVFLVSRESVLFTDMYYNKFYDELEEHIVRNPISIIVLKYDKNVVFEFVNEFINNKRNRKVSFKNTVVIFTFESKNRAFCERIGYCGYDEFKSINDKYLDEVIDLNEKSYEKLNGLILELNKNGYRIIISSEVDDSYFDQIVRLITSNLTHKEIEIKLKENNELVVVNKKVML